MLLVARFMGVGLALGVAAACACGNVAAPAADAAGQADAPPIAADAAVPDAGPPAARKASEIVTSGGRLVGGTFQFDVELGHPVSQRKMTGGTKSLEGAAVVKP